MMLIINGINQRLNRRRNFKQLSTTGPIDICRREVEGQQKKEINKTFLNRIANKKRSWHVTPQEQEGK